MPAFNAKCGYMSVGMKRVLKESIAQWNAMRVAQTQVPRNYHSKIVILSCQTGN